MKARGGAARLDAGVLVEVLAGPRASTAIDGSPWKKSRRRALVQARNGFDQ
jgi:hypothetical protein